jgi:gelsolin
MIVPKVGSDLDHKIKTAAADGEPQWDNIGQSSGVYVWRIEQFRVVAWPQDQYGSFYSGDSYVVLNSYYKEGNEDKLYHDLHIWIGANSSQDEYGTAAYKMVEADEHLGGVAVQHREVQGHESSLFVSYFPSQIQYMEGGAESGFTHVEAAVDVPRLYRVKGTMRGLSLSTLSDISKSKLNQNDSFILYINNSTVYVWHGTDANPHERNQANTWSETLCTNGTVVTLDAGVDDTDPEHPFWSYFADAGTIDSIPATTDEEDDTMESFQPQLYQLSSAGAELMSSSLSRSLLNPSDVFLLDSGWNVYVWIGAASDKNEKLNAITWAHSYCTSQSSDPLRTKDLPLMMMKDGYETSAFLDCFSE